MTEDKMKVLEDAFAEIEYCINSVQGALRHRKQPQDYHFHTALKACRDGRAAISTKQEGEETHPSVRSQALEEAAKVADSWGGYANYATARNIAKRIRALTPLPAPDAGWRDMESAPKDGTPVLLCRADMNYWPRTYAWNGEFWGSPSGMFWDDKPKTGPTHWLPLPAPPVGGSSLA